MALAAKLQFLYPSANALEDWTVVHDHDGERITYFNPALGAQPSQATLDAVNDATAASALVTRVAQAHKAAATAGIDAGGTISGNDLFRLIRAEALALLDAINLIRAAIPHPIVSITRSGTTATVTTRQPHGLTVGSPVVISGAALAAYNLSTTVATAPTGTTFTYTGVTGNPATPAAGSINWTAAEVPALPQITAQQVVDSIKAKVAGTPE